MVESAHNKSSSFTNRFLDFKSRIFHRSYSRSANHVKLSNNHNRWLKFYTAIYGPSKTDKKDDTIGRILRSGSVSAGNLNRIVSWSLRNQPSTHSGAHSFDNVRSSSAFTNTLVKFNYVPFILRKQRYDSTSATKLCRQRRVQKVRVRNFTGQELIKDYESTSSSDITEPLLIENHNENIDLIETHEKHINNIKKKPSDNRSKNLVTKKDIEQWSEGVLIDLMIEKFDLIDIFSENLTDSTYSTNSNTDSTYSLKSNGNLLSAVTDEDRATNLMPNCSNLQIERLIEELIENESKVRDLDNEAALQLELCQMNDDLIEEYNAFVGNFKYSIQLSVVERLTEQELDNELEYDSVFGARVPENCEEALRANDVSNQPIQLVDLMNNFKYLFTEEDNRLQKLTNIVDLPPYTKLGYFCDDPDIFDIFGSDEICDYDIVESKSRGNCNTTADSSCETISSYIIPTCMGNTTIRCNPGEYNTERRRAIGNANSRAAALRLPLDPPISREMRQLYRPKKPEIKRSPLMLLLIANRIERTSVKDDSELVLHLSKHDQIRKVLYLRDIYIEKIVPYNVVKI